MKIYIGADHRGFELKESLITQLKQAGYKVIDEGDKQLDPNDDFPQFAERVVRAMQASDDQDARGILLCGSGQGMCMAANRFKGVRASLAWNVTEAKSARNDDDSNVLCLPAHMLDEKTALRLSECWLEAPFAGAARYKRRIRELDQLG